MGGMNDGGGPDLRGVEIALGVVVLVLVGGFAIVARMIAGENQRVLARREDEQRQREAERKRWHELHAENVALKAQLGESLRQHAEAIDSLAKLRMSVHDQRTEDNRRELLREAERVELKAQLAETSRKLDAATAQIAAFTCRAESLSKSEGSTEPQKSEGR
jgi:cell division protein FtsB